MRRLLPPLCLAAWVVLAVITLWALRAAGPASVVATFIGDYGHPWRAQFNTDLFIHAALAGGWIAYRERFGPRGLLFGLLAVLLGALFTLPYLAVAAWQAGGNGGRLLLGNRP